MKRLSLLWIMMFVFKICLCQNTGTEIDKLKTDNLLNKAKIETLEAKVSLLKSEIEKLKLQIANIQAKPKELNSTNQSPGQNTNQIQGATYNLPPNKVSQSSSSVSSQCKGITKKGSRCSRVVKSGSYCYQHGG